MSERIRLRAKRRRSLRRHRAVVMATIVNFVHSWQDRLLSAIRDRYGDEAVAAATREEEQ